jgi:hypothetical protein
MVEAMESMEMAPGALSRPGRVPEQRLLSPKIGLRRRRCCRTFLGKTPINLGFRLWRALYRRRGGVRGRSGPTHHRVARPRGHPRHQVVWWPLAPLWLSFGLRHVSRKIGGSGFVSCNSENISCETFLKHKIAENRELTLWHLVNRLVLENA